MDVPLGNETTIGLYVDEAAVNVGLVRNRVVVIVVVWGLAGVEGRRFVVDDGIKG